LNPARTAQPTSRKGGAQPLRGQDQDHQLGKLRGLVEGQLLVARDRVGRLDRNLVVGRRRPRLHLHLAKLRG
jgi:hypothetical protein